MERNEKQIEIDISGLFHHLKKWFVIILAAVLVCGVAGFLYAETCVKPTYAAETRLYVLNRSSTTAVQSGDFQLSDQLLKDYQVLITGKNVTGKVVEDLGLKMSPNTLAGKISVTALEETRVLQIVVSDGNPDRAAQIANKVCQVAAQELQRITDADAVNQLYEAEVPKAPSGPNAKRYMVIWGLIGLLVATGVLTVVFVLDDSIRSEEDVERYLGLSVLGVIPDSQEIDTASRDTAVLRKRLAIKTKKRK